MINIKCPFCGKAMEEIEPEVVKYATGMNYTCHKAICKNKDKHYGNGNIVLPFKKEEKDAV